MIFMRGCLYISNRSGFIPYIFFLLYKTRKTIWMFYRKFADKGDNLVDNPNSYNVYELSTLDKLFSLGIKSSGKQLPSGWQPLIFTSYKCNNCILQCIISRAFYTLLKQKSRSKMENVQKIQTVKCLIIKCRTTNRSGTCLETNLDL